MNSYKEHTIIRLDKDGREEVNDILVEEAPLTIYFNDEELVTLLGTPEFHKELAVGFLAAEGLIRTKEDILSIQVDEAKGVVRVKAKAPDIIAEKLFLKRYITTGCGKGTTFYNVVDSTLVKKMDTDVKLEFQTIFRLMTEMQTRSELYKDTGGVHSAALCDRERILAFREDVGRHNAADKIMGWSFLEEVELKDKFLLTSGRISSEILLKVAKMGIPILVSRSAPTQLAVKLANELGVTVVGFVRGRRMNIYTHPERII